MNSSSLMVVDLMTDTDISYERKLATQVCAGLFNRDELVAGPAYILMESVDTDWLQDVEGIVDPNTTSVDDFLGKCLLGDDDDGGAGAAPVAKGYIRYNATAQSAVLPNIVTLAGVLDAVPLMDGDPLLIDHNLVLIFDAQLEWEGFSEIDGTEWIYSRFANRTTALSKTNPGYEDQKHHPFNPALTGLTNVGLFDFIVKERLFNYYLNNGCIPSTDEYKLQLRMATEGPWDAPIPVYGYDNTWPIAGDLFEAETNCNTAHNMGQIASDGVNNLAFFSRKPARTRPILQNAVRRGAYNASKTYMAFIMGDGDNIAFIKGSRRSWMQERVAKCAAGKGCFPLLWTLSPHTLHLAPDWLQWYYDEAYKTQNDFFVLPPSGHLYSYPGMMSADDQATFVEATESDCELLNSSATVSWEFFGTWHSALRDFYPQYGDRGIVRSIFPVNVPFMLPVADFAEWGDDKFFEVYGGRSVIFKPREWRGTACKPKNNCMTAANFAAEINGYPMGTVTHSYVTSDGGFKLQDLYDLVALLDEHVELVDHETLANFALAAAAAAENTN